MDWRGSLVIVVVIGVAWLASLLPPIPQPAAYHDFAASSTVLGIPNFGDVVSNAGFLLVGAWGLVWVFRHRLRASGPFLHPAESWPFLCLFAATLLVATGSAYYHWDPTHERLYWDRLPMTAAFMAVLAAILAERIDRRIGLGALIPLVLLGAAAATYWRHTELQGVGDLRPYLLVQATTLLVGPLLILLFRSPYTRGLDYIAAAGWYLLALVAETLDHPIHSLTDGWLSGHTLKHLLAATAIFWILRMLRLRRPAPP